MTIEELTVLQEIYDTDRNGTLCKDEIAAIVKSYNEKTITDARIISILKRYDTNEDGTIDGTECEHFKHELDINETSVRYAGYTTALTRLFRYLAFTSDFGEALRPVVSKAIVNTSYAVAIGYCFADVGWDAYKLRRRGYVTEKNEPMSMTQCIVERATFQAVASMIIPTAVIHTSVDIARKVTTKYGRYQKWGPSLVGLSIIPLLPMYLDHPVGEYVPCCASIAFHVACKVLRDCHTLLGSFHVLFSSLYYPQNMLWNGALPTTGRGRRREARHMKIKVNTCILEVD